MDEIILLNVPYQEKDEAKALGAKWNPGIRKWYITSQDKIEKFERWLSEANTASGVTVTAITQENMKEYMDHLFNG